MSRPPSRTEDTDRTATFAPSRPAAVSSDLSREPPVFGGRPVSVALRAEERQLLRSEVSAFARAASEGEPFAAHRSGDSIASLLLPPFLRVALKPWWRARALGWFESAAPGLYGYLVARTREVDDWVVRDLPTIDQLVLLGAGFDSRPYRFANRLWKCRVFEVDHRLILKAKRRRLQRAGIPINHVTYVEADLQRESLVDRLDGAGYARNRRTVFLMTGVTPFLATPALRSLLWLVHHAAPHSTLLFDYVRAELLEPRPPVIQALENRGGPILGPLPTQELDDFLEPFGVATESLMTGDDLRARHFGGGPGALAVTDVFGLVRAVRG